MGLLILTIISLLVLFCLNIMFGLKTIMCGALMFVVVFVCAALTTKEEKK